MEPGNINRLLLIEKVLVLKSLNLFKDTPENILADLDVVLVMSVNPGFGGQKFITNTYSKIYELKNLIIAKNSRAKIEIDGGIDFQNAAALVQAGADVLVAGNSVFSSENPAQTISVLKNVKQNTVTV